jgi:hypothetical protein
MSTDTQDSTEEIKKTLGIGKKASKQQKRQEDKEARAKKFYLNSSVPRSEVMGLMQQVTNHQKQIQSLLDRIAIQDIVMHSLRSALVDYKIISEKDLMKSSEKELEKFNMFQEINKGSGDFANRLAMCKKHKIEIQQTNILPQLKDDKDMSDDDKKALLKKYKVSEELLFPKEEKKEKE